MSYLRISFLLLSIKNGRNSKCLIYRLEQLCENCVMVLCYLHVQESEVLSPIFIDLLMPVK